MALDMAWYRLTLVPPFHESIGDFMLFDNGCTRLLGCDITEQTLMSLVHTVKPCVRYARDLASA
jgi:hypothetical protein